MKNPAHSAGYELVNLKSESKQILNHTHDFRAIQSIGNMKTQEKMLKITPQKPMARTHEPLLHLLYFSYFSLLRAASTW